MELTPTIIGFFVGILVGATSTGGGALLTPALVLIARVPPAIAIGSDVLIASGMKLFGGGFYAIRREVHWPTVGLLAIGSIPGAVLGISILNKVPVKHIDSWLTHGLGIVLILAGSALLLRIRFAGKIHPEIQPIPIVTIGLGFITGLLVSMTSVGSGSLLLCVLTLWYPLNPRTIVGTDLMHALALSAAATVGHAAAGRVDVALAGTVLIGAVPGVLTGARIATTVPDRMLRTGLASVLIIIGAYLALFGMV